MLARLRKMKFLVPTFILIYGAIGYADDSASTIYDSILTVIDITMALALAYYLFFKKDTE